MNRFTLRPFEICNDWLERLLQRRTRFALGLFMALCLNLAIAPALYAATGSLSRGMPTPSVFSVWWSLVLPPISLPLF